MARVAIIVPIYNVEKYLEKCLDSLVNQTYQDIEIICVNDGSTDKSQIIVDHYVTNYPLLLKSFIKQNGGLSDARNYGIKHSKSEYLAFIDSDDYIHPRMIEVLTRAVEMNQSDISVCDMEYIYDSGELKFSSGGLFDVWNIKQNPELLLINNSACNKLFKRELFNNIEFIKGIWYEDLATIPKLLVLSNKVVKVDEVFYYYIQRSNSIVHTRNMKVFDIYIAISSIKEFLIETNLLDMLQKQLNKMYVEQALYLTNIRIKDYDEGCLEFYQRNYQLIDIHYKNWFWNPFVWNQGFKKWVGFALFKFRLFNILQKLYKKSA